jgi:hypothetical protein
VAKLSPSSLLISLIDFPPACSAKMSCWYVPETAHLGREGTPSRKSVCRITRWLSPVARLIEAWDSPTRYRSAIAVSIVESMETCLVPVTAMSTANALALRWNCALPVTLADHLAAQMKIDAIATQ